jgi:hypothetical protein
MTQLQSEAKSSGGKIILVAKGTYTGKLSVASPLVLRFDGAGNAKGVRMRRTVPVIVH